MPSLWNRLSFIALAAALGVSPLSAQRHGHEGCPTPGSATTADCELVRRAALDYIEGFYEGDSTKLVRSVRPEAFKYGFYLPRDSTRWVGDQMTFSEMMNYARGVKQRNQPAPPTAPKGVELLEVQNQTAAVKVTAFWGTDYLLIGKYDGRWMISHVLWQASPKQ